jgi:hypothetical protein
MARSVVVDVIEIQNDRIFFAALSAFAAVGNAPVGFYPMAFLSLTIGGSV